MRLLFCTTDGAGAFNGINAWLLDFLPALAAAGHQPVVLLFCWSPPGQCHTYPRLLERGIEVRTVYPRLYTEAAVRLCLKEARRFKPDAFVASHVVPALFALPALRAAGIPGVSILHNDDEEYRAKASLPADATVAVSQSLLHLIPSDGRVSRFIPYGVSLSPHVAETPQSEGPLRLVYHGRIANPQKRIVDTAGALARLCRAHPRVQADLYGSGPDEQLLRAQLARDDADGRVRYLGSRSSDEIKKLLPDYHASVLLSDFEGLPVSVLESMSAGLVPVCLRTASGLPQLLRDGENGFLLSDRDQDLERAVSRLLASPDEWRRMAGRARETIVENFSSDSCVGRWCDLLQTLPPPAPLTSPAPKSLPPPHPALTAEDVRHPGLPRAIWRWLRFGPPAAPLPR
ncbi:MAG: GDP-mannose-dependent alpha-(1-6)-phosphatidylinositol monomannoside mannosyltransferase [Verrucomicrobiota bacterium]|jgi:glycosyltransferase involved in cell wall biosynthesis